jgi:hypothetical protein
MIQPLLARDALEKRTEPDGIDVIGLHHRLDQILGKCFLQIRLYAVPMHADLPGVPVYGMAGANGSGSGRGAEVVSPGSSLAAALR